MKCPNRNCIEGDVPEATRDTEHLPLICPDCQKRFCPLPSCRYRELDSDNYCSECGKYYNEYPEELDEGGATINKEVSPANDKGLEDFMKAFLQKK